MIALVDPEDRRAAAGEYVLGTLDAADHAAFESALARDPALQGEVYAWQDRLLGLTTQVPPVEPSAALWRRIAASTAAASPAATTPRTTAPSAPNPIAWWQRVRPWQAIGGLALAMSLLLSVALVTSLRDGASAAPRYLALLQKPDDRSTGWVVEIVAGRTLHLVPIAAGVPVPSGRALQFWTKPKGASGPTSLGLVRPGQTLELPVARLPGVGTEQLFEITLEPEGGSTIGRPTGPILYVGRTVLL